MKLWVIRQDVVDGYDTYDSAVVAAETAEDAKRIHPSGGALRAEGFAQTWALDPAQVFAELIGEAVPGIEAGVIVASFNAG